MKDTVCFIINYLLRACTVFYFAMGWTYDILRDRTDGARGLIKSTERKSSSSIVKVSKKPNGIDSSNTKSCKDNGHEGGKIEGRASPTEITTRRGDHTDLPDLAWLA